MHWKRTLVLGASASVVVVLMMVFVKYPQAFLVKPEAVVTVMWSLVAIEIFTCVILWGLAPIPGNGKYAKGIRDSILLYGPILFGLLLGAAIIDEAMLYMGPNLSESCKLPLSPRYTETCALDANWTPLKPFVDVSLPVHANQYQICIDTPHGGSDYEKEMVAANVFRYRSKVGPIPIKFRLQESPVCTGPL